MDNSVTPSTHTPPPLINTSPIVSTATSQVVSKPKNLLRFLPQLLSLADTLIKLSILSIQVLLLIKISSFITNQYFSNLFLSFPGISLHIFLLILLPAISLFLLLFKTSSISDISLSIISIIAAIASKLLFLTLYDSIYQSRLISLSWFDYSILDSMYQSVIDIPTIFAVLLSTLRLIKKDHFLPLHLNKTIKFATISLFIFAFVMPSISYPTYSSLSSLTKTQLSSTQKVTPFQILTSHHPQYSISSPFTPNTLLYLPQAVKVTLGPTLPLLLQRDSRLVQFSQVSLKGQTFELQNHLNQLSTELSTVIEPIPLPSSKDGQAYYLDGAYLKYFIYTTPNDILIYLVSPTLSPLQFLDLASTIN